jgi:hypothetical protein
VRRRIPIAYASLLIIALVAVVGLAAFSPSPSSPTDSAGEPVTIDTSSIASARVASAVLALRIADSDTRVATTQSASDTSTTVADEADEADEADGEPEAEEAETATEATTEATAPPETAPPTTTTPRDTTPPPIAVTSHKDGHTVTKKIVTFYGTSEHDAVVSSGPFKAEMAENGEWEISLVVEDGANGARFTATDEAGNTSSVRIVVYYDEPQATTTTKAAPKTTPTTKPASSPTTTNAPSSKWSPNWPADSGGIRNVEYWRSTVENYWPADRVDCALGIIQRESKGDPRAYNSGSSAEGLMQHLSKYWVSRAKGAGFVDGNGLVATPFNGAANIAAGAYLANYYDNSIGQWWNPWKSGGSFTAFYGSCQSGNP